MGRRLPRHTARKSTGERRLLDKTNNARDSSEDGSEEVRGTAASNSLRLVSVPEDDCFIAAMLTAASVLEGIHKDNPSNEEKRIWSAANAPVINRVRQQMVSVIFTIHTGATQAWGGEAMNKLFGDIHFNKNRWRKIVAQDQQHNPRQP